MTNIYVVTFGEYSDYKIEGIFNTKELAKEYICKSSYGRYHIEEYELNNPDRQCIKMVGIDEYGKEYPIDEWYNVYI